VSAAPPYELVVSEGKMLYRMFTVLGPASHDVVSAWGAEEVTNLSDGCHTTMGFQGSPVVVFKSSGLGAGVPGWTVIVGEDAAAEFFRKVALQVRSACWIGNFTHK
jgi:hypothetical protein